MTDLALVRHRIENLLATYAALADIVDADALSELLADATVVLGDAEPVSGREAIAALYRRNGIAGHHLISNLLVSSATTATARYMRWSLDNEPRLAALGTYHIEIDPASWRITRLALTRDWHAV
ncbi:MULTISPECIES: nuclear transport factor 2 family protein [Mycolicibacterium]|uniref:SnoaL-like domain-containing protein n=1 Tax=Mycolicibacterium senegalense TaxID=1796 RepID=A0A378W8S4_9MYCO|nr:MULTISPECIES: nuclear transport factor 2 family protein [Mycolicibacterium]MCV7336089.1 nuclear transport factor 2 family protein [Mycolicibacterium senegalense]MDR7287904.1 hypothetical protein [Mycolicibacterium senegalense]QZA24908.1 nuclear transport factor 2 family protein [Mycolicibacterium senegalense]CDP86689.1 hypothetical protein BN975_02884 [Mycolicibacterium farcinogenes]SUA28520.1 Uncharacterised protein [Mycolicibacterium senegalense]